MSKFVDFCTELYIVYLNQNNIRYKKHKVLILC